MPSNYALALLTSLVISLAGCSYFKYPDVHKLTIRQGNVINQQMVDQLRPGMTRSQVRYILGTPLTADTFHQNRWDYFYSIKRPGREELRERVSVFFDDDKLTHFTGDYRPSAITAAMATQATAQKTDVPETAAGKKTSRDVGPAPEAFGIDPSTIDPSTIEPSASETPSADQ